MNEITIPYEDYLVMCRAMVEVGMLRNLFQKHLESNEAIFTDELKTICAMLRIEVKQDA